MQKKGKWVTINGAHVFIGEGETAEQALEKKNKKGKIKVDSGKHTIDGEDYDYRDIEELKSKGYEFEEDDEFDETIDEDFRDDEKDPFDETKDDEESTNNSFSVGDKIKIKDSITGDLKDADIVEVYTDTFNGKPQYKVKYPDGSTFVKDASEISKSEYKAPHTYEDFEDARFYPVSDEDRAAAGPRYLGRHFSLAEAHGVGRDYNKEKDTFQPQEPYNGYSIYKDPYGYYSINPQITDMSFKTREALQNYLDKKNPEEHKYGVYFEPGDETEHVYTGRDEQGNEYNMEAPDAYKAARNKAKSEELGKRTAKMPNGKEMTMDEFVTKAAGWTMQDEGNLEILADMLTWKYGVSENEALDYIKNKHHTGKGGIKK